MSAIDTGTAHDASHDAEHHDHPAWLAHHFDDPEQQFDSGKLGMWLFLVTEVLFFSGMFCAYAIWRSMHPEVFTYASKYLNETLGAVNTGVLLFSSLTMAWGVRCAQLAQRRGLVACLGMTLACASIFLGVKTVEYSHKWDLGIFPGGFYVPQGVEAVHHEGISPYLLWLCAVPAILSVGTLAWYVMTLSKGDKLGQEMAGPIFVAAISFFGGVGLGTYIQSFEEVSHVAHHDGDHHDAAHHGDDDHAHDSDHADSSGHAAPADANAAPGGQAMAAVSETAPSAMGTGEASAGVPDPAINQPGMAGIFFSIYYCMTGVHAIHILAGMGVLTWLIVRAAKGQFHSQYFGPVDYVGLYWHLVDFIWIFLFPLLYLIGSR